jgi:hypothetical protein
MRASQTRSVLGSAIASALTFFEDLMPAYLYFFMLRNRVVNQPITPDPSWRLAMVVTKAPSEPWPLVRRTLEAMLTQDLAQDTWLTTTGTITHCPGSSFARWRAADRSWRC